VSQTSAQGKIFDGKILGRILKQVRPYRREFLFTGFLVVLQASIIWIRPELIRYAIDAKVAKRPPNERGLLGNFLDGFMGEGAVTDSEGLLYILMMVVGLLIFEAIIQFYQTYLANWVAQSVTLDLRSQLYSHILKFKLRYFDKTPVGAFVTRLVSDIDGIADVFSNGILSVIGDLLKLFVVIGIMFFINWKLTFIVLIPIPILLVATRVFQKAIKKAFIQVRNQVAKINVFVQEHVTGMSVVQVFHREESSEQSTRSI
jgi:ATP-binding cassette, subfamily B, multidrug efflux pump